MKLGHRERGGVSYGGRCDVPWEYCFDLNTLFDAWFCPRTKMRLSAQWKFLLFFSTRPMGNRSVAVRSDYVDTIATFLFYIDWRISRLEVVMGYWPVCVRSGLRLDKMKSSIIKKSSARIINSLPWPSTPTINRKNNFSKMVSHT